MPAGLSQDEFLEGLTLEDLEEELRTVAFRVEQAEQTPQARPLDDSQRQFVDALAAAARAGEVGIPSRLAAPAAPAAPAAGGAAALPGTPPAAPPDAQRPVAGTIDEAMALIRSQQERLDQQDRTIQAIRNDGRQEKVRRQRAEFDKAAASMGVPDDLLDSAWNDGIRLKQTDPKLRSAHLGDILNALNEQRPSYFRMPQALPADDPATDPAAAAPAAQDPAPAADPPVREVKPKRRPKTPSGGAAPRSKPTAKPAIAPAKSLDEAAERMKKRGRQLGI